MNKLIHIYNKSFSEGDWNTVKNIRSKVKSFGAVTDLEDELDDQSNDLNEIKSKIKKLESELKSKKLSKSAKDEIKKTLNILKKLMIGGVTVAGGAALGAGLGLPTGYLHYDGPLGGDEGKIIRTDNGTISKVFSELDKDVDTKLNDLKYAKAKLKDLKAELRSLNDNDPKDEEKRSNIWKHIRRLAALIGSGALAYGIVSGGTRQSSKIQNPLGKDMEFKSMTLGEALSNKDTRDNMMNFGLPKFK